MILSLRVVADRVEAGRKARELARLLAAGLPVAEGVVVFPDDPLGRGLDEAVRALGPPPYVVRSSSMQEDTEAGSAAGLYDSHVGVSTAQLSARIAAVRTSAMSDVVRAYLAERGLAPHPIAVLVQRDLGACVLGVARSRADTFSLEERPSSAPEWADADARTLSRAAADPLATMLGRIADLSAGPIAVEYARTAEGLVVLQSRPVLAVPPPRTADGAGPWGRWRLDAEHNPDPLSRAQADLVALVDGARFGARARVIDGYLYVRQDAPRPHASARDHALHGYETSIEPRLRAELATARDAPLTDVLDTYRRVLTRYAVEVRPAVAEARDALRAIMRPLGESLDAHAALLGGSGGVTLERDARLYALGRAPTAVARAALVAHLAQFGAYAPAWDVSVPCDEEDPARVLREAARRAEGADPVLLAARAEERALEVAKALRTRLGPSVARSFDRALATLRERTILAENDDRLFFEAQRVVRRALLRRGAELVAAARLDSPSQIFDLPLVLPVGDLREIAEVGHRAREAARRSAPPFRYVDRAPRWRDAEGEVLRGRPAGGTGRGPAVVHASLDQPLDALPPGAVLVVSAALPSLAPHLSRLAGLVTEHGGAFSHAITLARELGVAAVVGVAGATRIPSGADLFVDGERGRVLVFGPQTGPGTRDPGTGA